MSSINDIIEKASALIVSLDELLQSQTVQSLPGVASQLGIEDVFNEGVRALSGFLTSIDEELGKLGEIISQLDAVGGLLGLLQPLVGAMGRMIGGTGEELASYGLSQAVVVTGPVSQGFQYAERALQVAQNFVIDTADFEELRDSMFHLAQTVHRLATDVPDDAVLERGATP